MYEVCLRTVRNQDKITYYHVTKQTPPAARGRCAAGPKTPSGSPHGTDDKEHTRRGIRKVSAMQRQQEG